MKIVVSRLIATVTKRQIQGKHRLRAKKLLAITRHTFDNLCLLPVTGQRIMFFSRLQLEQRRRKINHKHVGFDFLERVSMSRCIGRTVRGDVDWRSRIQLFCHEKLAKICRIGRYSPFDSDLAQNTKRACYVLRARVIARSDSRERYANRSYVPSLSRKPISLPVCLSFSRKVKNKMEKKN